MTEREELIWRLERVLIVRQGQLLIPQMNEMAAAIEQGMRMAWANMVLTVLPVLRAMRAYYAWLTEASDD